MLVYFMLIWFILCPFDIYIYIYVNLVGIYIFKSIWYIYFYGHLAYFMSIWYIMLVIWYRFPILVSCTKSNQATLLSVHPLCLAMIDIDSCLTNENMKEALP
jgi:hypothetical protein